MEKFGKFVMFMLDKGFELEMRKEDGLYIFNIVQEQKIIQFKSETIEENMEYIKKWLLR
jgi:hypothetical protein